MRCRYHLYLMMLVFVSIMGCHKEEIFQTGQPETQGCPVTICAAASTDTDGDATKVYFGPLTAGQGGQYFPACWNETGEALNLSEFYNTSRSQDVASSSFTRISSGKATFTFTPSSISSEGTYDYVAISPKSAARTTGTAAAKKGRASFALAPATAQKPGATSPDPACIIMTARDLGHTKQASKLNLAFTHQTAYSKMSVKNFPALADGESVTSFKIQAPEGKYLSGRYWYDYSADSCTPYDGSMENYVLVDPSYIEINSTSFDIWWVSLPLTLSSGETLSITATTSKGNSLSAYVTLSSALALEKGKTAAYTFNWAKFQDKVLSFDFETLPSGWPTTLVTGQSYSYGEYSFTHYGYDNTTGAAKNRCSYNSTSGFLTLNYGGFLSLPALKGYKLVKVNVKHKASKSSTRQGGVSYGVRCFCDSVEYVTAGGKTGTMWDVAPGTDVEMPMLTSLSGHQYYLTCTSGGLGIGRLELTYAVDPGVDPAGKADAFTVGNLNIWMPSARTSKKESGAAPAEREWEYARYNIRDIIKDNAFDILGVQEATLRVRNDVKTDLSSTGKYEYQYFLHKPATPSTSSSVGIIYNKNRFSLSDAHQFWLSPTPDTPGSVDPRENTPRSAGCAVLTDSRSGKSYFVMVAHASLDDDANADDVGILIARMNQYNSSGLPMILIGDLNANWSMPMYTGLSAIMDDARYSVELDHTELMHPGTYNGSAGKYSNLKERSQRIDFVFTSKCSVYSYKVSRNKYAAGATQQYPSDHCPPVVICK